MRLAEGENQGKKVRRGNQRIVQNWLIHIAGQVQGVGFRPTVARIANTSGLTGRVYNTSKGVSIELTASVKDRDDFLGNLLASLSPLAIVSSMAIQEMQIPDGDQGGFFIIGSENSQRKSAFISPDFGICQSCQSEVLDPKNRRFLYPFISCVNCGPRYSILEGIPYDRELSSMKSFVMCQVCRDEYQSPHDRRFHSQTNACADCGMELSFFPEIAGIKAPPSEWIDLAVSMLTEGKILAVKATAGFLLLADATAPTAVLTLRERKKRPRKPLALMVADTNMLADYFLASDQEKEWMESASRPIVLCRPKIATALSQSRTLIAPGLSRLGVCLPADPLMFLLAKKMGRPIISTSGNLHESPVQSDNAAAIKNLYGIADAVLLHNREIHFAQDDSVGRVAKASERKIILRRSRGLAPTFWNVSDTEAQKCTLAMGADLKSSFALWDEKHVFVSQYLGNLESFETQMRYTEVLRRFLEVTGKEPELILVDRHPGYHSRRLASIFPNAEVREIPHHEAHFAALLWEHSLLDTDEPVLGVVWDGLGFGNDGSLWGSEFFAYQEKRMAHLTGFEYFDNLLGDKMSREPRLAALSLCGRADLDPTFLKCKFSDQEWSLYLKLLQKSGHPQTNSMGRIFDALASMLDITDFNTFEGEAAMHLEQKAQEYLDENDWKDIPVYTHECGFGGRISLSDLIVQILKDKSASMDHGLIAAKFHLTLVSIVKQVIEKSKFKIVAFSGGVFQNALLVDLLTQVLGSTYKLLFHEQLSPNDENIALGQLAWMHIQEQSKTNKSNSYVLSDSR